MSTDASPEKEIFADALELASAAERDVFLARVCGSDSALRQRVDALLRAHAKADAFLSPKLREEPATVISNTPLTEREGSLIGRYKLLEKLGEGGFGAVYVAEQREPVKRRVALKIIKLGMDTKHVVARFEAERQALALMDHPHIARVLDAGSTDTGRPYFVMELVRGMAMTKYCDDNNLPTCERLNLFLKVCHAIQHAHQKGIIHRDIKPSNILVTLHDGVPVPKVIDFGIAKATQGELTDKTVYTQFQQFIGTPAYMSPEQAEMSGLDVDTRSDIYSLGVLLYELLVGKTPFDGKELLMSGLDEMRRTLREKEPLKPSTRLRDMADEESSTTAKRRGADLPKLMHLLRGDLDWIVMKCLEKDRTRRYDTANGLAMDIQRHLTNEPVVARPPSQLYRLQKMAKRNKIAFTAAAAVSVAFVLGLTATTLGWRAARAERDKAVLARQEAEEARAGEAEQLHRAEQAREEEAKQRREAEAQRRVARLNAYAADMKAAQVALAQNSRGQAADLLERYRPAPGEEDLRGIEWRYLWQAVQGDEIHTWQHPSMVIGARFSPDGQFVVSDSFDGFLRVWDVRSRKPVTQLQRDAHRNFWTLSFCFSPDGRTLAMTREGTIELVDTADWQVARRLDPFVGGAEGRVGFPPLAWSPNGEWLAASLRNGIRLWSTADWTTTLLPSRARGQIAFAPDNKKLAVCAYVPTASIPTESIELWNVPAKEKIRDFPGSSQAMAISPDGQWLAAGRNPGELKLWNLRTGQAQWTNQAHRSAITGLTFSSDGQRLASGAYDQVIHIWDVAKQAKVQTFRGHLNEVWSLEFSPDDRYLVSASKDGTVKLWEMRTQRQPTRWWMEMTDLLLGFSSDGRRLITITTNGTSLHHWEGPQVSKAVPLAEPLAADELSLALLSSKRGSLVVVSTNGMLRTYSVETGRSIRPAIKLAGPSAESYRLSPSDRWLAGVVRSADGASGLHLWDTTSGASAGQFPHAVLFLFPIAFSKDDRLLAIASSNATVQVWDLSTTKLVHSFTGHSWFIQGLAFSRDGKYLASSGADGDVRVWDVAAGTEMVAPLRGHGSGVNQVAFSSDGKTLFSGGFNNTVRFWQMPTGREMLLFDRMRDSSSAGPPGAKWSPTDELLALWDFERQALRVETIPALAEIEEAERRRERSQ